MSEDGDPNAITDALQEATDAVNETGHGLPAYEEGIETDHDWTTQLTKACKLLQAIDQIDSEGHHTTTSNSPLVQSNGQLLRRETTDGRTGNRTTVSRP